MIMHSLEEGALEQYPEMKEKLAAALSAAKLALDESAAPYLEDVGILSKINWFGAEADPLEKGVMDGFDAVLNSNKLNP